MNVAVIAVSGGARKKLPLVRDRASQGNKIREIGCDVLLGASSHTSYSALDTRSQIQGAIDEEGGRNAARRREKSLAAAAAMAFAATCLSAKRGLESEIQRAPESLGDRDQGRPRAARAASHGSDSRVPTFDLGLCVLD